MVNEDARVEQLNTLVQLFGKGIKAELARKLGVTDARIGMWYTRKFIDVVLVAEKIPELNANWLLRNIGEPLETDSVPYAEQAPQETESERCATFFEEDATYNVKSLLEENKRLLDESNRLREDMKGLRDDIEKLRTERDTMFDKLMEKV